MPNKKINEKETIPVVRGTRGRVVSAKLPQTVTVLVEREKMHPLYGRAVKRGKKYLVFDPIGVVNGDLVEIQQIRPLSKNKHFAITRVLGRDIEAIATEQLKEKAAEEIARVMPEEKEELKEPEVSEPEKPEKRKTKDKKDKKEKK